MYAKSGYSQNSHQRYRAVKVQTASPAQVMLMLFDGAIRFARMARQKIEEQDMAGKGTYIGKVQAIVTELMSSLDFTLSPELCTQLQRLYVYMIERLTDANIKVSIDPLDEVIDLLTSLRDTNKQALDSLPQDPTLNQQGSGPRPGAPTRPGPVKGPRFGGGRTV